MTGINIFNLIQLADQAISDVDLTKQNSNQIAVSRIAKSYLDNNFTEFYIVEGTITSKDSDFQLNHFWIEYRGHIIDRCISNYGYNPEDIIYLMESKRFTPEEYLNLYKISKVAAREKLFQGNMAWDKEKKIVNKFRPGDVVEYNGYNVITTFDGAFSTYLKPGQLGVVINEIAFGEIYNVSWEIGGGYMMTAPVKKEYIIEVSEEKENRKLELDKRKDDILTTIVAPEHDIAQQSREEMEKEFSAEPPGNHEMAIDPPGESNSKFTPINKVPAMKMKASNNQNNLKKVLELTDNKSVIRLITASILTRK